MWCDHKLCVLNQLSPNRALYNFLCLREEWNETGRGRINFRTTARKFSLNGSPPLYSGPALKVVHFDGSGHFGRSHRNVLFHLTKLLYSAYKNNNQTRGGLGRVCTTGMCLPLGTWNFRSFKPEFLLSGKHPNAPRLISLQGKTKIQTNKNERFLSFPCRAHSALTRTRTKRIL